MMAINLQESMGLQESMRSDSIDMDPSVYPHSPNQYLLCKQWSLTPSILYVSKTPPTNEELIFQLQKSQQDGSMKVVVWIVVGLVVFYLLFK